MDEKELSPTANLTELVRDRPEEAAIELDTRLKTTIANERESWIYRANLVYLMKETEVWRYHPGNYSSLSEYCAQPEIDIAPAIVSDMVALCKYAPHLAAIDIDIWEVIRRAGQSKVRQLIPQIREAERAGVLRDQITPLIESLDSMSFREVLEMTSTSGVRSNYEFEAVYTESDDGEISVTISNLDIDELEYIAKKANVKRFYSTQGLRIDPLNDKSA